MDGLLREMEHWRTFIIVIVLLPRAHKFPDSPSLSLFDSSGPCIPDQPAVSGTGANTELEEQVDHREKQKPDKYHVMVSTTVVPCRPKTWILSTFTTLIGKVEGYFSIHYL